MRTTRRRNPPIGIQLYRCTVCVEFLDGVAGTRAFRVAVLEFGTLPAMLGPTECVDGTAGRYYESYRVETGIRSLYSSYRCTQSHCLC